MSLPVGKGVCTKKHMLRPTGLVHSVTILMYMMWGSRGIPSTFCALSCKTARLIRILILGINTLVIM